MAIPTVKNRSVPGGTPITAKGAAFRSLGDVWADTTTPHGRLMLTVLGDWWSSRLFGVNEKK